ncbi:uncharacterized protein B0P05DRAFT_559473 [Gilbertella persicaria]|uniref:uncharacterized protein n=1 Tax=Gilbertella persicaria TaxID=101096 RepID=UPI002220D264|nr:uncharacterized protein B0P05DRAFT_559473 [Gilbertella persicaria]KAI8058693.1 hypothetical protein B0P05DRAFT_559473 [Gilbertella persicaria]
MKFIAIAYLFMAMLVPYVYGVGMAIACGFIEKDADGLCHFGCSSGGCYQKTASLNRDDFYNALVNSGFEQCTKQGVNEISCLNKSGE